MFDSGLHFQLLFSNALRNDLQHPNEYIRGATLRFLCKIREAEVLEPLIASVRACLVIPQTEESRYGVPCILKRSINRNIDIHMCAKTLYLLSDLSIVTLTFYFLTHLKLFKPSWLE